MANSWISSGGFLRCGGGGGSADRGSDHHRQKTRHKVRGGDGGGVVALSLRLTRGYKGSTMANTPCL